MSTKFVLFSDIHEHAVFSPRALLDKRFFGLMNSTFCRHGDYRMERVDAAVRTILDSLRPDLVIFTGDAVSTSDPREFEAALKQLRPLVESGMPILFSPATMTAMCATAPVARRSSISAPSSRNTVP